MTHYYVKNLIQDNESKELISVEIELEEYCRMICSKVYSSMYMYEEDNGVSLTDSPLLRSNFLDIAGAVKRIPLNIYIKGDSDE